MNKSPAIEVDSLKKTYSEGMLFRKRFEALKGISLQVNRGEVFGLLGPNGAGKTTFIKIMLGIIRKTSGRAQLMGHPAGSRAGRRLVGYLPEHLRIPPHMTAHTALECYGNLSNVPNRVVREKRGDLLQLVGLADRARDRCKQYSKGMLQRLGLAQSLLHDPEMLVLDEPTDGLDPRARAEMRAIINKLKDRGVTIFLNSHLLQEVEMICNRVAILDRGNLMYNGLVSEIGDFIHGESDLEFEVQVTGAPDEVNNALQGFVFEVNSKENENNFTFTCKVKDQSETDRMVDSLRQHGVSIRMLQQKQVSLESAFLQIIKGN